MEQNPSIISHDAAIEQPIVPRRPEVKPKDGHSMTIVSMAIFVILSLTAVAFLYFQNQKLKEMVASYQVTPSSSPTETPNSTANWETYVSEDYGFTFKHPLQEEENDRIPGPLTGSVKLVQTFAFPNHQYEGDLKIFDGLSIYYIPNVKSINLDGYVNSEAKALKEKYLIENALDIGRVSINNVSGYRISPAVNYSIYYFQTPDKNNILSVATGNLTYSTNPFHTILPNILSTFEFLDTSTGTSPEPVACTQEAKLCPDGKTYVGRTGPSCEFAVCP